MISMTRATRQKVVAAAAVAVLLAGGAIAAVSATGQSNAGRHRGAASRVRTHVIATAATYLGVSPTELTAELRSGRSLAQIADATGGGKSANGLIEALEAARRAKLAAVAGSLPARVSAEVNRPGGPVGAHGAPLRLRALFSARRRLGAAVAAYLGKSAAQLKRELRAGTTLAQIADATAGKSERGLIAALVAAERRAPAAAAARAGLTAEQLADREKRLQRRAKRLVQRQLVGAPGS